MIYIFVPAELAAQVLLHEIPGVGLGSFDPSLYQVHE